jgi:NADPH2:quinone reductase
VSRISHAIRLHAHGGPEQLRWEAVELPDPGAGEVLVRQVAAGLNFIDVYERTGLYKGALPSGLGREAAGTVESVGARVRDVRIGERVAYVHDQPGAYAEKRILPAERLVRIPDGVSEVQAAAVMLKGMTAHALLRRVHRLKRNETVVVHAAAGGVGLLLTQWANALGARVIGVVGSEAKAELAERNGCRHVVVAGRDDLVARVRQVTRGRGADVVYDSVGQDTFMASLDCLRRRGLMVSYGNASGPVAPFAPLELARRGSLFLTRPTLFDYIATRRELQSAADELFAALQSGAVQVQVGRSFRIQDAGAAHRELEARRTTGSTVLLI